MNMTFRRIIDSILLAVFIVIGSCLLKHANIVSTGQNDADFGKASIEQCKLAFTNNTISFAGVLSESIHNATDLFDDAIAITAYAADIASGTYDGVSWRITSSGELILGNGQEQQMTDNGSRWYTNDNNTSYPWLKNGNRKRITSVRIDGTIICKGSLRDMFFKCTNL